MNRAVHLIHRLHQRRRQIHHHVAVRREGELEVREPLIGVDFADAAPRLEERESDPAAVTMPVP